jgi:hypothetical protein
MGMEPEFNKGLLKLLLVLQTECGILANAKRKPKKGEPPGNKRFRKEEAANSPVIIGLIFKLLSDPSDYRREDWAYIVGVAVKLSLTHKNLPQLQCATSMILSRYAPHLILNGLPDA